MLSPICPEENMDWSRFNRCKRTDPTTCFDTSKDQTLSGRCGFSLHLLKTRDDMARMPKAPCTSIAKGPSSLHSPLLSSSSGVFEVRDEVGEGTWLKVCDAAAVAILKTREVAVIVRL